MQVQRFKELGDNSANPLRRFPSCVVSTPDVAVDGEVVHVGGVPGADQVRDWMRG